MNSIRKCSIIMHMLYNINITSKTHVFFCYKLFFVAQADEALQRMLRVVVGKRGWTPIWRSRSAISWTIRPQSTSCRSVHVEITRIRALETARVSSRTRAFKGKVSRSEIMTFIFYFFTFYFLPWKSFKTTKVRRPLILPSKA